MPSEYVSQWPIPAKDKYTLNLRNEYNCGFQNNVTVMSIIIFHVMTSSSRSNDDSQFRPIYLLHGRGIPMSNTICLV